MKYLSKFLKGTGLFLIFLTLSINVFIIFTGKFYLYKVIRYNFSNIDDYKIFPKRTVEIGKPIPWKISKEYNKKELPDSLSGLLGSLNTVATLIIKNDEIVFEKYWENYSDTSHSNSFSIAKSMVSLLIGIAIEEKKINSIHDPVYKYLPEYKNNLGKDISILHLLTMSSGLNWDESYMNPLSMTSEAYYGDNLKMVIQKLKPSTEPGKYFSYKSGDTQILGILLTKIYNKNLSEILSEKIWKKIGAEHPAIWSLDNDNGMEKAYCCFNSNARDFARIGKLMMNNGKWDSTQIVPEWYVKSAIVPNNLIDVETNLRVDYYGLQWWILPNYRGMQDIFYARGVNGQYIIALPSKNMIIVRLGDKRGEKYGKTVHHIETLKLIDFAISL